MECEPGHRSGWCPRGTSSVCPVFLLFPTPIYCIQSCGPEVYESIKPLSTLFAKSSDVLQVQF